MDSVHFSSQDDTWSTPQDLFDTLDAEFHFILDVCALPSSAKCVDYYTPQDDAFTKPWFGTCWMNPPYGRQIGRWMERAFTVSRLGVVVVCLVPARTDTRWWWDYARPCEVRFLRGRLRFGNAAQGAPFPSAVVVMTAPGRERTKYWEWQ